MTEGVAAFAKESEGFDLVLDSVGAGVAEQVPAILKPGGVYVLVGLAGGETLSMPILPMLMQNGRAHLLNLFAEIDRGPETGTEILERLIAHLAEGYLTAPVGEAGPWTEIDAIAKRYMASKDRAKPVLRVNGGAA